MNLTGFERKSTKVETSFLHQNLQEMSSTLSTSIIEKSSKEKSSKEKSSKEKDVLMKAIKVRIYPTKEQKRLYEILFGCQREIYNACLIYMKDFYKDHNKLPKLKEARKIFVKEKSPFVLIKPHIDQNTNSDFRDGVIRRLYNNYKSNSKKRKVFDIKPMEKKLDSKNNVSIEILSKYWKTTKRSWWNKFWNPSMKCKDKRKFLIKRNLSSFPKMKHTSRLIRTPSGKYFISFPISYFEEDLLENQNGITSIDPGNVLGLLVEAQRQILLKKLE